LIEVTNLIKGIRLEGIDQQIFFRIRKLGSDEAIKQHFLNSEAMKSLI
jgi:hypothetical protein